MSGMLTTHVLDLMHGRPASGLLVELYRLNDQGDGERIRTGITNGQGRLDAPLLQGGEMEEGRYELRFRVGEYFRQKGLFLPEPPFLEEVPVRIGIADARAHYHVPLLITPWGYQVYRGS